MRKKTVTIAVLILCLAMLGYSTIAYFNTQEMARNVITTGNIDIELQETAINEDGEEILFEESQEKFNVMPGQEVSKIVRVKNIGSNPAYVRVKVQKDISLADGVYGEVNLNLITLDFDNINWTLGEGDYYYYNKSLAPGESTVALFRNVIFNKVMGNLYQGSTAIVKVNAQATQVKNNGDSVFNAAGWPDTDTTE